MTDAEQIAEARALVERLRKTQGWFSQIECMRSAATALTTLLDAQEAAQATIAELQADADEAFATATEAGRVMGEAVDGMKAAEAKLAKAVEALEDLVRDCEADYPPSHGAIKYFCRAALAEIKGESHE